MYIYDINAAAQKPRLFTIIKRMERYGKHVKAINSPFYDVFKAVQTVDKLKKLHNAHLTLQIYNDKTKPFIKRVLVFTYLSVYSKSIK